MTVLPAQNVVLPNMPPALPTDPTVFFINIPFTTPFPWAPAARNMLIQVTNRGNSNGNAIFTYPLDAGSGVTSTRLYASPETALTGTATRNYGHVMLFGRAGGGNAVPVLATTGRPVISTSLTIDLSMARPGVAVLLTGSSNTSWGAIPLPLDLTSLGAPGCSLLASGNLLIGATAVSAGGTGGVTLGIPNDAALVGLNFYNQYAVVDPSANVLGFAFSRGGNGKIGNS
jgi:hypothetical protein